MKEEIRDYKLVRWYPNLPIKWDSTHSYQYNRKLNVMVNITLRDMGISPYVQSMPLIEIGFIEYWKKNKPKTLFVTEDGVEVFKPRGIWSVNKKTLEREFPYVVKPLKEYLYFAYKSNADEYIWKNKRVFSYQDMMKAKHSIILTDEDIEKAAKERIK